MALTASIATLCAITLAAIRWLAVLGVLRDYAVAHTSGSVTGSYTASPIHRQLGLLSGPSDALTDVDYWAWKIGFIAGVLWLLRLALRSANHRIGVLRTLGIVLGLGAFVATGVAHRITDSVIPSERARWMNRLITLWCFAAVSHRPVLQGENRVRRRVEQRDDDGRSCGASAHRLVDRRQRDATLGRHRGLVDCRMLDAPLGQAR